VLVVLSSGKVVRSAVAEVPAKGRDTMGVVFARFAAEDRIIAVARNSERNLVAQTDEAAIDAVGDNEAVPVVSPGDVIDAVDAPEGREASDEESTGEGQIDE